MYKLGPVGRPILFEYRDQNQVEFIKEGTLLPKAFFGGGALYDNVDYEIADA